VVRVGSGRCALFAVVVASIWACGPGDRALEWYVDFADPGVERDTVRLGARVIEGGCGMGDVLYQELFDRAGPSAVPPVLPPGTYGFEVVGVDADCVSVGRGCTSVRLPLADGEAITTVLVPSTGAPPFSCEVPDGAVPVDAALPDSAVPDADGGDTAVDAAPGPMLPSNIPPDLYVTGSDLDLRGTHDTDDCTSLPGSPVVIAQPGGGPELCVLRAGRIVVEAGEQVRFVGGRAVVLLGDESVTIDGDVDIAARIGTRGAGGSGPNPGADGNSAGTFADGGGGGGGGCGRGGDGGDGDPANGGNGGAAIAGELAPLAGGGGGGDGARGSVGGGGGAGGGALQLTSRGTITINGSIDGGGGGGGPGEDPPVAGDNIGAGGGGGGGGSILLEAPDVSIDGATIRMNGGGGGGSAGCGGHGNGRRGQDGRDASERASGGAAGERCDPGHTYGATGGRGGGGAAVDGEGGGSNGYGNISNGAGGGGAAGCILIRNESGAPVGGSTLSPSVGPGFRVLPLRR